jgi:serine/threonine protein kinase
LPQRRDTGKFAQPARIAARPPGSTITTSTCANCGTAREPDAVFCSRCGLDFTAEFRGTPIHTLEQASPILVRLREEIGDRYSVERELGRGGMATVFLARDIKHDREVAIKVLHPELSASIGSDRFEREIKLAARLQHPHILGLYDSGSAGELLYYVMPFVRGESLRDRIAREGMLPIDDAVRITLEVCDALGHAHAQGIVHRDIKPENILLSNGHALVADFGIARAASEAGQQKLTQTGMAVGTPVYMAPEQSTGDAVGPTADLYSLGCVLYEMLVGEPPFTGSNAMAIMARHLMETVPSVRVVRGAVPEELEQAIFIALNKQAVDRPQNAAQFAELMGMPLGATGTMRVMRGTQARARMTTAEQALAMLAPPPMPWWRKPLVAAGVAALVLASAGGVWAYRANRPGATAAADPNAKRVAVLYIAGDPRDASTLPLADGLTEGLIRALERSPSITLIPRSGSERFRGSDADAPTIAGALRAGYLIRGELEPEGDRVRIGLRLLHSTGVTVERASFAVARDSLLLLQDSLAATAATLLGRAMNTDIQAQLQRSSTTNDAAWLAVQQGAQLQRDAEAQRSAGDDAWQATFARADSAYARAEALDARWPEPLTRRAALAYRRSRLVGRDPAAIRPWLEQGIAHADRAIALAPSDADALEVRGTARYFGVIMSLDANEERRQQALAAAQRDLELATAQNPNQAGAWATLSHMYNIVAGKDQSDILIAAKNALRADEFQVTANVVHQRLFNAAYDLGQFDQAEQYCTDLATRFPTDPRAWRCQLYLQSVPRRASYDVDRAWRLADSLVLSSAPADSALARLTGTMFVAATIARQAASAPSLADSARVVARRSVGDATIDSARDLALFGAYVFAILGDEAEAVRLLAMYISVNPSTRAPGMRDNPGWFLTPIKDTPAFQRLVNSYR